MDGMVTAAQNKPEALKDKPAQNNIEALKEKARASSTG